MASITNSLLGGMLAYHSLLQLSQQLNGTHGEEMYCEPKVSCLRAQHNTPSKFSKPDHLFESAVH